MSCLKHVSIIAALLSIFSCGDLVPKAKFAGVEGKAHTRNAKTANVERTPGEANIGAAQGSSQVLVQNSSGTNPPITNGGNNPPVTPPQNPNNPGNPPPVNPQDPNNPGNPQTPGGPVSNARCEIFPSGVPSEVILAMIPRKNSVISYSDDVQYLVVIQNEITGPVVYRYAFAAIKSSQGYDNWIMELRREFDADLEDISIHYENFAGRPVACATQI